jgi:hypothetical protein
MPKRFTPSERGTKQPFAEIFLLLQVTVDFYKKVLEKYCPPLGGGEFQALSCPRKS